MNGLKGHDSVMCELENLRGVPCITFDPNTCDPYSEKSDREQLCKRPLVSVHMITYNHEGFIREAIEGVVQQQCDFEFELIIGEDCSTDRTREICFEYQEKYPAIIRVLYSGRNVGGHQNSWRVWQKIRGEYIAFCEGDDMWCDKSKLQRQRDILKKHPEVGLVYCEGKTVDESGTVLKERSAIRKEGVESRQGRFEEMFSRVGILTCSVMMRGKILHDLCNKIPLFKIKLYVGDVLLWMTVLETHDYYFVDRVMVVYHKISTSAMRRFPFEVCRDVNLILLYFALQRQDELKIKNCVDSLLYARLQNIERISSKKERFETAWRLLVCASNPKYRQRVCFYLALLLSPFRGYSKSQHLAKCLRIR